jgi:exosortase/archaeosortase family protein
MESSESETIENPSETDEDAESTSSSSSKHRSPKKQIVRFVVVFIVLVMTFLSGYRYMMDTNGNMRYLYIVSTHTAWVLGIVGHSGEVEPYSRDYGQDKTRAEIAAWDAGEEYDEKTVTLSPEPAPLSGWEVWKYKAIKFVKNGQTLVDQGPMVEFVYEQGTNERRMQLTQKKGVISRDDELTGPEKDKALAEIEKDLAALVQLENTFSEGPERMKARTNTEFSFRVVPDCGAIPSMSIFVAAVLAFPSLLWKKGVGILGGLAALYWINVSRLSTLAFIGAIDRTNGQKWFNFIHEYVWQGIFLIFVVAIWMVWIELFIKVRRS